MIFLEFNDTIVSIIHGKVANYFLEKHTNIY